MIAQAHLNFRKCLFDTYRQQYVSIYELYFLKIQKVESRVTNNKFTMKKRRHR